MAVVCFCNFLNLIDIFRKKQIYKNIPELKNTTKPTLKTVEACQVGLFSLGPSKALLPW